ncbi:type II secretion system GspH family protein [Patescibacteria group bacterium]|nr:type II secretion system GspH family protein [Patescibacteria group bacterium]
MYKHRSQGFTLIELLVVIAIIGVLSAVVLASLNTARSKGNDAAIQSDLSTIQTEAEIYYGGTGGNSYGTAGTSCTNGVFSDATIAKAIAGAKTANGGNSLVCNNSTTAYAVSSNLSSNSSRYWCVDSTGGSSNSTTALGTNTVCPASN